MTFSSALYALKNRLRQPFYAKPQSYRVALSVRVANRGKDEWSGVIVLPIPQEAHNQKCGEEMFSEQPTMIRDARFGNRVACFAKTLAKGKECVIDATFLVTVAPSLSHLQKQHAIDAYALSAKERASFFSDNPLLVSADAAMLAASIAPHDRDVITIIQAFNEYVITHFTYGDPMKGLYSAHDAFAKRVVDCGGFDTALCALCISRGIPARIVSGFWAGRQSKEMMHAWCEIMLPEGTWIAADPSVEYLVRNGRDRTRSGRLGYIGSDHITFSIGCDIPIDVGVQSVRADILQHPFLSAEQNGVTLESSYHATII